MAFEDIGIDLGTASVQVCVEGHGIVLEEPSVVAVNTKNNTICAVGEEAYKMIGRTPAYIRAIHPLEDGVISSYEVAEKMVQYFLKKCCKNSVLKPRVVLCVPSGVTEVEARAVVDAAVASGARRVYLIEEPVAAALGADIDISQPNGRMVVDIGGGTTDIAVISLSGVVTKSSIKLAGQKMDQAVIRYIRQSRGILIGAKTAEQIKKEIGSVYMEEGDPDPSMEAKGRDLALGLPRKFTITRRELTPVLQEMALQIIQSVQSVVERTPPELVGDIFVNGLLLTGGGAMIDGLDRFIQARTRIRAVLAKDPVRCVARGTVKAFQLLDVLQDGFFTPSIHIHQRGDIV